MLSTFIGNLATKLIILFFGLLFLMIPAYKLYTYGVFRYHAVSVEGIIIDSSSGKELGGRPFVEYKDFMGNSYERKSQAKTHWFFTPKVGEKVNVFYNKRDPNEAIVDSAIHYIVVPLGFSATGISFLFCLVRDILYSRRHSVAKMDGESSSAENTAIGR